MVGVHPWSRTDVLEIACELVAVGLQAGGLAKIRCVCGRADEAGQCERVGHGLGGPNRDVVRWVGNQSYALVCTVGDDCRDFGEFTTRISVGIVRKHDLFVRYGRETNARLCGIDKGAVVRVLAYEVIDCGDGEAAHAGQFFTWGEVGTAEVRSDKGEIAVGGV